MLVKYDEDTLSLEYDSEDVQYQHKLLFKSGLVELFQYLIARYVVVAGDGVSATRTSPSSMTGPGKSILVSLVSAYFLLNSQRLMRIQGLKGMRTCH